jgi:hypothetical protein
MYPAKDASTKYVIKCFRDMIKTCGAPNRIIFEQGTAFTSRQFSDFAVEIGTTHHVCFRVYHEEMVRVSDTTVC